MTRLTSRSQLSKTTSNSDRQTKTLEMTGELLLNPIRSKINNLSKMQTIKTRVQITEVTGESWKRAKRISSHQSKTVAGVASKT